MNCPCCQESAKFIGYRSTTLTSVFGAVTYERAYYHCRHCKTGWFPSDAELRIKGRATLAAAEVVSLAGLTTSFEQAAKKLLRRLSGLRVSKSTVHRILRLLMRADLDRSRQFSLFGVAWRAWRRPGNGRRHA